MVFRIDGGIFADAASSTYKLERQFFRTSRRIAPHFARADRDQIGSRLNKILTHPAPGRLFFPGSTPG